MRQIKFKAWDRYNQKFIMDWKRVVPCHYEGSKYPEHGGVNHNCVYVHILANDSNYEQDTDVGGWIGECELLLFTGLKDKTGKEIYEGDIIEWGPAGSNNLLHIKYSTIHACFDVCGKRGDIDTRDMLTKGIAQESVIIGNIYENPDIILSDK